MASEALKCNICPKKPKFSDVSHLLTHVSSKGHLSHYFKLQVRSHQEPDAVELLAAYNKWYSDNNLADLLSERLKAKDARKTKGSKGNKGGGSGGVGGKAREGTGNGAIAVGKSNNNNVKHTLTTSDGATYGALAVSSAAADAAGNSSSALAIANKKNPVPPHFLDPRLSQPYTVPDQRQNVLAPWEVFGHTDGTLHHSSYSPVPSWPLDRKPYDLPPVRSSAPNGWKREPSSEPDEEVVSPLARKSRALLEITNHLNPPSLYPLPNPPGPDPFVDEPSPDIQERNTGEAKGGEATKLKGILLPGMDIFDSATEQMRRRRNQKKDGAVLKQMESMSEVVEPTEFVFSPSGTLRKERFIYALPEDITPLKGETPILKRRIPRGKHRSSPTPSHGSLKSSCAQQLNEMNGPRHFTQLEHLSRQALPLLDSSIPSHGSFNFGNQLPAGTSELKLAFPGQPQRHGHGFSVYNDEEQASAPNRVPRTLTDVTNIGRDRKRNCAPSMNMDINSRFPPYDTKAIINQNSKYHRSRADDISTGKENIDPALGQFGRSNMRTGNASWINHPFGSNSPRFAPQYSYGTAFPGGYSGFAENEAIGYTQNPLSYPYPAMTHMTDGTDVRSTRMHDPFASPDRKPTKPNQAVSPDGTLSDIDQADLEQMYLNPVAR